MVEWVLNLRRVVDDFKIVKGMGLCGFGSVSRVHAGPPGPGGNNMNKKQPDNQAEKLIDFPWCLAVFENPYASHEKGTVENRIWQLRRFFPKGTDFNKVNQHQVKKVERLLNNRPVKKFNCCASNLSTAQE